LKTYSDRPVVLRAQDALSRSRFASRLARLVATTPAEDGLVVGLEGPWGEGKTSVLNFVEDELRNAPDYRDAITVVRFNPWYWSGTEQLVRSFFGVIATSVRGDSHWDARLPGMLEKYGSALAFLTPLGQLGAFVGSLGSLMRLLGKLGRLQDSDKDPARALAELKSSIDQKLLETKRRIVVLIDDTDRLLDSEIREVTHLVKLTADFPDVVYVLAYDRRRVAAALDATGASGDDYLRKIVQIPLELPRPHQVEFEAIAYGPLRELIAEMPQRYFSEGRWSALLNDCLRQLVTTVRDGRRLANGLAIAVSEVGADMNPVDLIGISALRVFAPELYEHVKRNEALYCATEIQDRGSVVRRAIDKLEPAIAEPCTAAVRLLFPLADAGLSGRPEAAEFDTWLANNRVCSPAIFPRYFSLSLPPQQVSDLEVDRLIASLDVDATFNSRARELLAGPSHEDVMQKLAQRVRTDTEVKRRLVDRLLPLWDDLYRNGVSLRLDDQSMVGVLAYESIKERSTDEDVLTRALEIARDAPLGAAVYIGLSLDGEQGEYLLEPEETSRVTSIVLQRLTKASDSDLRRLGLTRSLVAIRRWSGLSEVRARVASLVAHDADFVALLEQTQKTEPLGQRILDWEALHEWFEVEALRARASVLSTSAELPESSRQLVTDVANGTADISVFSDQMPRSMEAEEQWLRLVDSWNGQHEPQRTRTRREIVNTLLRRSGDGDFFRAGVVGMPAGLVAELADKSPRSFARIVRTYAEHVRALRIPFDFKYLDKAANFYRLAYRATRGSPIGAEILTSVVEVGAEYDETDLHDAFVDIVQGATEAEIDSIARVARANPKIGEWLSSRPAALPEKLASELRRGL
jgi:KAP-like P-loop domain-containing protein